MSCNDDFFGTWAVEYLDEPGYSGRMVISNESGGIAVTGTILKNGRLDGSYSSTDAQCPSENQRQMSFVYTLGTGNTGRLTLNLSEVDFGQPIINGSYVDTGSGGDTGRVRLQRPSLFSLLRFTGWIQIKELLGRFMQPKNGKA